MIDCLIDAVGTMMGALLRIGDWFERHEDGVCGQPIRTAVPSGASSGCVQPGNGSESERLKKAISSMSSSTSSRSH